MDAYRRMYLKDTTLTDEDNKVLHLKRGKEYLTGKTDGDKVCVMSTYWAWVPISIFEPEQYSSMI